MISGRNSLLAFSCLCICSATQADVPGGADQLVDLYYRFEVAAVYCGLVNDRATKGYYSERKQVVEKFGLDEAQQIHASGQASQLAHKEWMNRGLGGFKPWCRNEGQKYADAFSRFKQLEAGQ